MKMSHLLWYLTMHVISKYTKILALIFIKLNLKKDGAVYTQGALLKKKKLEEEEKSFSILGRLYALANNQNKNIHVNLVSNKPFQDSSKKKSYNN